MTAPADQRVPVAPVDGYAHVMAVHGYSVDQDGDLTVTVTVASDTGVTTLDMRAAVIVLPEVAL